MKRFAILITISILILTGIGASIYFWFGRKSTSGVEPVQAIPIESSIIFKIENFAGLADAIAQNKRFAGIGKIYEFQNISKTFIYIDSIYRNNTMVKSVLDKSPMFIALCAAGGSGSHWISAIKLGNGVSLGDVIDFAKSQTVGTFAEEASRYNQSSISTFKNPNPKRSSVSFTVISNVLVVSSSKLLVEKAIGQIDNKTSLTNNPQFTDILKISGKGVVANMFVNYKQLPAIIKTSVNDNYQTGSKTFADLALWTEFDICFNNDNLTLSGLSNVADSTNSYLQIFAPQKPVAQSLPNILPASTGAFLWFGISDKADFLGNYRDYLDRKRELFKYSQTLSEWKSKLGVSADELFDKILVNQLALAFMPSISANEPDCWFIVENTNSPSATRDFLLDVTKTYIKNTNADAHSWKSTVKIDRDKEVDIYRFPATGIHNAVWGSLFPKELDSFFCFIDNNIVLGESAEALTRFIMATMRNNTLGKDVNFNRFSSEISQKANFCFYANPARAASIIREFTKSPLKQFLISSAQSGLLGLSYQMIGGNSYIFNSFTIASGKMIRTSTNQTAWVTKLDERPTSTPQIVINHNTREREVFVQDSANTIYLINSQGRILWKRQVNGQLTGIAHQVDVYRNGKLQLAFSTPTMLYIIDRNGKDVSGFPVKLPANATNTLSVADYDNNRNYRFFQACDDKKIYVFDPKGKQVRGWEFGRTETAVASPIQFFRVAGNDYILVFDNNRPYILNRKGDERIKPSEYFVKATNSSVSVGTSNGNQCFITTDTLGLIRTIATSGKVESLALKTFSNQHVFCYTDIDADGNYDYIVLDGQTISAFNQKQEIIFSTKIAENIDPQLMIFSLGSNKKIGLVDAAADNIYLINSQGKTENTFPLQGNTPFSITKFNPKSDTYNLIVGTKQGAVVNYEIR